MKISKSKQELARIISGNGGWRDGRGSLPKTRMARCSITPQNRPLAQDVKYGIG